MSILDINKLKLQPVVKEAFDGQDVYILPTLNSLDMIARYRELTELDKDDEAYSMKVATIYVRYHIVDKKGKRLFAQTVDELMQDFNGDAIDRLYGLVEKRLMQTEASEPEKNS
jgi:hypothetical protein